MIQIVNHRIVGSEHALCPHCGMDIKVYALTQEETRITVSEGTIWFDHECPIKRETIRLAVVASLEGATSGDCSSRKRIEGTQ